MRLTEMKMSGNEMSKNDVLWFYTGHANYYDYLFTVIGSFCN